MKLSIKDASEFSEALQLYEKKEYKTALRHIDNVLKRRKDHGESLCLRGLCRYNLGLPDADSDISEGTRIQADSPVGWHMAGIYYKLNKDYTQAFAAFLRSFTLRQDNQSVQQDLSMLAMQQRQFPVLVQVRTSVLASRPGLKMSWLGLAIAHYLNNDPSKALRTLAMFQDVMKAELDGSSATSPSEKSVAAVELSEILFFQNTCIRASQGAQAALDDLAAHDQKLKDRVAVEERRAKLLEEIGRVQDAASAWRTLLRRNPNNSRYYDHLLRLTKCGEERFWREMLAEFGSGVARSRLLYAEPTASAVKEFTIRALKRGTPAAFEFVKPLYGTSLDVINEAFADVEFVSPTEKLFWVKHLSYSNKHEEALTMLDELKPEVLSEADAEDEDLAARYRTQVGDYALVKAKVLQRAGDLRQAAEVLLDASKIDPGDRDLNTKTAKYFLRAGLVEKGSEAAFKFPIRGGHAKTEQEALAHSLELENVELVLRLARGYQRARDHGLALKRAQQLIEVFQSYRREEYDFHYYGPKRGTVTAYLGLVEWENELWSHPRYLDAVEVVVSESIFGAIGNWEADGTTERERQAAKRRRAKLLDSYDLSKDQDPLGQGALASKTALDSAFEAWKPLESAQPTNPRTWELAFALYLAQKKYVLAVQALKKAQTAGSAIVPGLAVKARYAFLSDEQAPEVLRALQLKMLSDIVPGDISGDLVSYTDEHITSLPNWAEVRRYVNALDADAEARLVNAVDRMSIEEIELCLEQLRCAGRGDDFYAAVLKVWPRADFPYLVSGSGE